MNRIPIWVWFIIPTILIIAAGAFFFSKTPKKNAEDESKPAPVSNAVEGTHEFNIVSRQHITNGGSATDYNSNPPTSGQHWPAPVKNGIYDKSLPDEQVVHSMEHGYVWISYKSGISEEIVQKLKEIVGEDDWKVILSPRDKNDSQITIAAWGRLLNMESPDYEKLREFIKTYRNRGPEKTPD